MKGGPEGPLILGKMPKRFLLALLSLQLAGSTFAAPLATGDSSSDLGLRKLSSTDAQLLAFLSSYRKNPIDASILADKGASRDVVNALGQLPEDLKAKVSRNESLTPEEFDRICFLSDWCGLMPRDLLLQMIRKNMAAATDPASVAKNPVAAFRIVAVVSSAKDSAFMFDFLRQMKLPDVRWFLRNVAELAKADASWSKELEGLWAANRGLIEFQYYDSLSVPEVAGAINSGQINADIKQNNRLTELGTTERIVWANTVYRGLAFNESIANFFYYPLIIGYPEGALSSWLSPWSQEKHNQALVLLTTSSNLLNAPQVQRLTARFDWKSNIANDIVRKLRLDVLDKLDVKQLDDFANTTVSEVNGVKTRLAFPTLLKLLNNGFGGSGIPKDIPKGLANISLVAYPATQIKASVIRKDVDIDLAALVKIASPYLSLGQCLVLFDSYARNVLSREISGSQVDYLDIPYEFLKHAPFYPIMAMDKSAPVKDKLALQLGRLDTLLPSQRLAVIWKLSEIWPDDRSEAARIMNGGVFSSPLLDTSASSMSLLRLMSSKVYQMTSLFERLPQSPAIEFAALNPIGGISCSALDKLDTTKTLSAMFAYNQMLAQDSSNDTIVFLRPSERRCFMKRFRDYLAMKNPSTWLAPSDNSPWNMLSPEEVLVAGGSFFTELKLLELREQVPNDTFNRIVFALGRVSPPQLIPLADIEWLEAVAKQFLERRNPTEKYMLSSLKTLGGLAMYLDDDLLQFRPDHLRLLLEASLGDSESKLNECACLPSKHASGLKKTLYLVYGAPNTWTASQILKVSNLLWVLGDNLKDLNQEELRKATPFLLRRSCSSWDFEYFPGFLGSRIPYDQACYRWLGGNESQSAVSYKSDFESLMRLLLFSSQLSVDLASSPKSAAGSDQVVPPSGRADVAIASTNATSNNTTSAANMDNTAALMYSKTLAISKSKYTSSNMTADQTNDLSAIVEKMSTQYKKKLSEILKIPVEEVDPQQLSNIKNFTTIQMQMVREQNKIIQKTYVEDIVRIFGLTEEDYGITRQEFCLVIACSSESASSAAANATAASSQPLFIIKYDPDFATRTDVTNLIRGAASSATFTTTSMTCNGIVASGVSARFLKRKDLEGWTSKDLYYCLDVLGETRFPSETKEEIWNLIMSKTGDMIMDTTSRKMNGATMIFLRQLLDTIASGNPDLLTLEKLKSIDAVSFLGTLGLPSNVTKIIGSLYYSQNYGNPDKSPSMTNVDILELASLGQIFCGLPQKIVEAAVQSPEAKNVRLLGILGGLRQCQDHLILGTLADQADKDLKGSWSPFDVAIMGIIVAGLAPQRLASLSPDLFRSLTSTAVSQLTEEQILALSPSQIRALPSETLGILRMDQMPLAKGTLMDLGQMAAFEDLALEDRSLARILQDYKSVAKSRGLEFLPPKPPVKIDRLDLSEKVQNQTSSTEDTKKGEQGQPEAEPAGEPAPASAESSGSRPKNGFEMAMVASVMFAVYLYLLFCCLEGH